MPVSTKYLASSMICLNGLEYSGPLVYGTTQKWQNLSQPSWIVKNEEIFPELFLILLKYSNFEIASNSVSSVFFFFLYDLKLYH